MAISFDTSKIKRRQAATSTFTEPELEEGDVSRRANAGIFGDLFDLLARPGRATATAAKYALDDDKNTDFFQGLQEGITGKSKSSYSDVLKDQGIGGATGATLGFLGDVLLDPLTYTGVKPVRGLSKDAAKILAAKTTSEEGAEAVAKEAARLQATNPTHLYLTFAGKKVTPSLNLPNLGVKDAVFGSEGNRTVLAKAASRKSELPFGLANKERIYMGGSAGRFSSHLRGLKEVFEKNLTPEERELITHAIEADEALTTVPLTNKTGDGLRRKVSHPEGFATLEDYRLLAKDTLQKYFDDEQAFGLLSPEQFRSNYVPHFFKKPPSDILPGLEPDTVVRPGGPNKESFMKKRKASDMSLDEARKLGYEPITDIAELLEIRASKHHRVVGRAAFLQDAVDNFAVAKNKHNAKFLDGEGWLDAGEALKGSPLSDKWKGKYLPESIVRALNSTDQVLRNATVGSKVMKSYDSALNQWKFLNTAVNPGYHIRNTITDFMMNAADGVLNPKYYKQARRILQDRNVNVQERLLDPDGLRPAKGFENSVNVGKRQLTTKEAWEAYVSSGAKSGFITTELTRNTSKLEKKGLAQALAVGKAKIGDVADTREDFFRLAHYLKVLDEELPKNKSNFLDASMKASERVRKYNIDYGNLSSFERTAVNKAIPFYSFMRQNMPLQIEMLFTKPGFMALYPKGQDLMQGLLGTEDGTGEYLIPEWIRNSAPVRVAMGKQEANSPISKLIKRMYGAEEGEAVFLPSVGGLTPLQDLANVGRPLDKLVTEGPISAFQEAAKTTMGMTTPFVKAPFEAAYQKNLFTGQDIEGTKGWMDWLLSQVGPARQINAAAQGDTRAKAISQFFTGIPLQTATKERQAGELSRREKETQEQIAAEKQSSVPYKTYAQALSRTNLPPELQEQLLSNFQRQLVTPQTLQKKSGLDFLNSLLA